MKTLSPEALDRARSFLATQARPLERALAAFRFDGGTVADVRTALGEFANADGGFGHALEPDVRTPSSSALATGWALRVLAGIGCAPDDPLVVGAVDWLVSTYDPSTKVWRVVPKDTNNHPHAPWWHDEDGSLVKVFGGFQVIPRALLVAHLHWFARDRNIPWLDDLTETTARSVEHLKVLGSGGGSDLEYVVYLATMGTLPKRYRERLVHCVRRALPQVVERDAAKWGTYCVTPLRAAPTPDSLGADLIREELEANVDHEIDRQDADGAWNPTWAFEYPTEWAHARDEWRGIITLDTLTSLKAFGRVG